MKKYEMILEMGTTCDGTLTRDVNIREIETDQPLEEIVKEYITGKEHACDRFEKNDGVIIFEYHNDGIPGRLTFTPIN